MKTTTLFTENNPTLFSIEMNVDIADFLHCAFQALSKDPGILDAITNDLDKHTLEKKRERLAEAEWIRKQTLSLGLDYPDTSSAEELILGTGRPRMSADEVYLFVLIRGYFSSVTDRQACEANTGGALGNTGKLGGNGRFSGVLGLGLRNGLDIPGGRRLVVPLNRWMSGRASCLLSSFCSYGHL